MILWLALIALPIFFIPGVASRVFTLALVVAGFITAILLAYDLSS